MLWLVAPLAAASTVHLDTDGRIDVAVGAEAVEVRPSGTTDVKKVDAGTHRVTVTVDGAERWTGTLGVPDDAEVWLAWRGGDLVLAGAGRESKGGGLMKAMSTAAAVGAGVAAAADAASATSAAVGDVQAAQRGEAVESSHTEVRVEAGPGGVQSSTSRTTAGASGVHSEGSSTSIGPDGVSRDTGSLSVDGSGVSSTSRSTGFASIPIDEGGSVAVTLTRDGATATATLAAPAPVAAPAPAPARVVPKEVTYRTPEAVTAGGALWTLDDGFAEAGLFKLAVRIEPTGDAGVVWEPGTATASFDGVTAPAKAANAVTAVPGDKSRKTLVYTSETVELRAEAVEVHLGTAWSMGRGADLALGTLPFTTGSTATGGAVVCTVRDASTGKKGTSATVECANGGADWVWLLPGAAKVLATGGAAGNESRKLDPILVAPGAAEKLTIEALTQGTALDLTGAVLATVPGKIEVPKMVFYLPD